VAAPIVIFSVVSVVGVIALAGYFALLSVRQHRVHPGVWAMVGTFSIFWLEGPYDWAGFCNYHPDHWFFPQQGWGPLSAPFSGLPVLVMGAYVLYFTVPAMIAAALAKRFVASRGWNVPRTLLTTGLIFGIIWDVCWENLGVAVGIWRFSSAAPGLVMHAGERNQYPLYVALAMAIMVMTVTYLLGRDDTPSGRAVIEDWAGKRTSSTGKRAVLTIVATVVVGHVVYLPTMIPLLITRAAGLQTEQVSSPGLFPGYDIPLEPNSATGNSYLGMVIILAFLVVTVVAVYGGVQRLDPKARPKVVSDDTGPLGAKQA
jgi:hypothetical protein